ncbi:ABC transporter permease, partial [bacterium]|nr:ABC transporter permease [bacterium]
EDEGIKSVPKSLREAYGRAAAQLPFYLFTAFTILLFFDLYNWPLLTIASGIGLFTLFAIAVIPLGLFLATFMKNQYSALSTLMFMSAPLLMISGFAMPLFAMPRYIQWIAMAFPTTPALAIMRMISNKSTDIALIMPSIIHLITLTIVFMVLLKIRIRYLSKESEDFMKNR